MRFDVFNTSNASTKTLRGIKLQKLDIKGKIYIYIYIYDSVSKNKNNCLKVPKRSKVKDILPFSCSMNYFQECKSILEIPKIQ